VYWGLYSEGVASGANPDLGLAVAKKLVKRAVDRNRIKRMVRNLVWAAQSTGLNKDVVVKLKKPIGQQTRGRLRKRKRFPSFAGSGAYLSAHSQHCCNQTH
jgi:ribonuclease P protein component